MDYIAFSECAALPVYPATVFTIMTLLFPKIVACLTELRSMNEEYTKQVLQIQDIQPDVSPLILEVVSKDP